MDSTVAEIGKKSDPLHDFQAKVQWPSGNFPYPSISHLIYRIGIVSFRHLGSRNKEDTDLVQRTSVRQSNSIVSRVFSLNSADLY